MLVAPKSLCAEWKLAKTTNDTTNGFSALLATKTRPVASATRAVVDRAKNTSGASIVVEESILCVCPFGGDADNNTLLVKVVGWNYHKDVGGSGAGFWVPNQ